MTEEDCYHYRRISDIKNRIREKVRIGGIISNHDTTHRILSISDDSDSIECYYSDQISPQISIGDFIQILGTVEERSGNPIIILKLYRSLNGVNTDDYNFAISKFNEFVLQQSA